MTVSSALGPTDGSTFRTVSSPDDGSSVPIGGQDRFEFRRSSPVEDDAVAPQGQLVPNSVHALLRRATGTVGEPLLRQQSSDVLELVGCRDRVDSTDKAR